MKKHSRLYKMLSVFSALVITAPMFVISVSASVNDSSVGNPNYISYNQDFYNSNSELCNTLIDSMENLNSEIDVEKYQLSINDIKKAMRTVSEISPDLFYVSKTTYGLAIGSCVARVIPTYIYSNEQIVQMRSELESKTNEILAKIQPNMTDFQKAAIIHDEIVLSCEYSNSPDAQYTRTSVYDCIVNGYANCQGYTSSMSYLLEKVGINSEIVESSQMNHIWNLAEIDGNYYHIDATFDDPTPDRYGFVSHKYFLLSDSAIKTSSDISVHYGFKTNNSCTGTAYDNSYYKNLNTKFCYSNNLFYAADNSNSGKNSKKLVAFNPETGYAEPVADISDKWYTNGGLSYWHDSFVSTDEYNGNIYFNLNNFVCKYNTANGTVTQVTNKINTSNYVYIYGMKVDNDGNFLADVKKSPLDDANIIKLNVLPENKQEKLDIGFGKVNTDLLIPPKFLLGDINEDGNLSILDVTLLQMICTNSLDAKESQKLAADYNADGQIDVNDATALQIYISKKS